MGTGRRLRLREAWLYVHEDPRALLPRHGDLEDDVAAGARPPRRRHAQRLDHVDARLSACGMPAATATRSPPGRTRSARRSSSASRRRPRPRLFPGPLRFIPGRLPLELGRAYRGSIQVMVRSGGLQAVNVVGLEDYVRGVVAQEVGSSWPIEALKAQAVASRAFAVATKKDSGSFDVYPDTRSQVYGGVNAEQFETNAAVQATAGKILTLPRSARAHLLLRLVGRPDCRRPGRLSRLEAGCVSASVDDPYDTVSPYHSWGPYVYGAADFAKRLGLNGEDSGRPRRAGTRRCASTRSRSTTSAGQQSDVREPARGTSSASARRTSRSACSPSNQPVQAARLRSRLSALR